VSLDVFGARGGPLTALASASHCSGVTNVKWFDGSSLVASGTQIDDPAPEKPLTVQASCGNAQAIQTLAARSVYQTVAAFAVLNRQTGNVVAWGHPVWGGNVSSSATPTQVTNLVTLVANERVFAGLKRDGSVVTWGSAFANLGNVYDSNGDPSPPVGTFGTVTRIFPGRISFLATNSDGSSVAWGSFRGQFSGKSYAMAEQLDATTANKLKSVVDFRSNEYGFAALLADGSVISWGDNSEADYTSINGTLQQVIQLVHTNADFAALKRDGTVTFWGPYSDPATPALNSALTNVTRLFANGWAFAALRSDNSLVTWGSPGFNDFGDNWAKNSGLQAQLNNVRQVWGNQTAFAALLDDGTVVSWGDPARHATSFASVQAQLTDVVRVVPSEGAFAALKRDGSVVTWGDPLLGGDSSTVRSALQGVVQIAATDSSFAALKQDGTVVSWGDPRAGGDSRAVAASLVNVRALYATAMGGFLAIRRDGSYVTWGASSAGGDSHSVSAQLPAIPF
jgi:alpha-tubulin suppressor-like RCC1 family protein